KAPLSVILALQLKPGLEAPGFGAVEDALSRGPSRRGGFPSYSREDAVSVRFILSGFDHALCGVVCYAKREGCAASCSDSRKLLNPRRQVDSVAVDPGRLVLAASTRCPSTPHRRKEESWA